MTDPQDTPPEDDSFLAAEFALGLAEGEDLANARFKLAHDRQFALKVAAWQESFARLTDDIAPVKPPRKIKKKLFKDLFPKQQVPLLERLWVWKGISFAAIGLLAYLAIPMLRPAPPEVPVPVLAAQLKGQSGPLELLAIVEAGGTEVGLRRIAGTAPEGRVLELWAILPEQAPLSLGVLPQTEVMRIALPAVLAGKLGQVTLAITDEPVGGAPDGSPTGEIRAVGALEEI
ncbi:anti-sigma factor [Sulfitobacter mediterraneus]|uniref:anti-sigma factor n=1 Tax=Sulfitobacter mediterraneus TaxID=83219 RepID=UPI0021A7035E|nr:anti-sigma factor [Sulfitobacter mediterraneus]UWR10426.1 anti-sigma factor [Sulfitobacter mediterraneus]